MAHRLCKCILQSTGGLLRAKPRLPWKLQTCVSKYRNCCSPKHLVCYYPYEPPCIVSHDYKNMTLGRPMSPHMTIYRPTLFAMTSIIQRATGIALSVFTIVLASAELFYPGGTCLFIKRIHKIGFSEPVAIALKSVVAAIFLHHYLNGLRFVFFNFAMGLGLRMAFFTASIAIALTLASSFVTALIGHYGIGYTYSSLLPQRKRHRH